MQERAAPHGGNIYKAAKAYNIARDEIMDYSANINPLGVPGTVRAMIAAETDHLVHYPDPDCVDLRESIAGYLNIPLDTIIIGNGASEIIFLLIEVLQFRKILMPAPTFSEYAKAASRYGVQVEYLELKENNAFRLDTDEIIHAMDRGCDAVFLCNPNNPTSTLAGRDELWRLIKHAYRKGIHVIIDEAFIELTAGGNNNSMVEFVDMFQNLFIIRAFTKWFAIPGLRLGYGIGSGDLIGKMWDKKLPWSVNTFACRMGIAFWDWEYIEKTRLWIESEPGWFYERLAELPGVKVFAPRTNFILIKILEETLDAAELYGRMARKGILIRQAGNFVFLNDKFFRVAVKDRQSNLKFLEVLKECLCAG